MVDAARIDHGTRRDTRSEALIHSRPNRGTKAPAARPSDRGTDGVRQFAYMLEHVSWPFRDVCAALSEMTNEHKSRPRPYEVP